jgi:hypothetical protein
LLLVRTAFLVVSRFILPRTAPPNAADVVDDDDAEGAGKKRSAEDGGDEGGGKAARGNGGKMMKQKGMNKGRKFGIVSDAGPDICQNYAADKGCAFGDE